MESNSIEMEVDQTSGKGTKCLKNVVAARIEVSLHPMVILNVSECHTRNKMQNPDKVVPIVGALIGTHQGRKIEILNCYELLLKSGDDSGDSVDKVEDSSTQMDTDVQSDMDTASTSKSEPQAIIINDINNLEIVQDFFESKVEQYKQVFPDYELVGWFTIGGEIDDFDKQMFIKFSKVYGKSSENLSENPLLLKLNPSKTCTKNLPVKVYESYLKSFDNSTESSHKDTKTEVCFKEVAVSLETEDGEKIVLDHVAENQTSSGANGNPSVTDRLRIQSRAMRMLRDRVKLIVEFVEDANKNGIEIDQDILRQISFIANRLPLCSPKGEFENDLNIQLNDNALLIYLGTLTKSSATMNKYVSRLNSFMPERFIRRRPV